MEESGQTPLTNAFKAAQRDFRKKKRKNGFKIKRSELVENEKRQNEELTEGILAIDKVSTSKEDLDEAQESDHKNTEKRKKDIAIHGLPTDGVILPDNITWHDRKYWLSSPARIRREMGRVYADVRVGIIDSQTGTRLIYILTNMLKPLEMEKEDRKSMGYVAGEDNPRKARGFFQEMSKDLKEEGALPPAQKKSEG